jgi:hypothetical protein
MDGEREEGSMRDADSLSSAEGPSRRTTASGDHLAMPRLLAFYQDAWDDDGTAVGWHTIAWGLALANGAAVTVPADGAPTATLWPTIDAAVEALDAYVDSPAPARRLNEPAPAWDARASTTGSRLSLDGSAARPACPDNPANAGTNRDRPPGIAVPVDVESESLEGRTL